MVLVGSTKEMATPVLAMNGRSTGRSPPKETFEAAPFFQVMMTCICYGVLLFFGHLSDLLIKIGLKKSHSIQDENVSLIDQSGNGIQTTHLSLDA